MKIDWKELKEQKERELPAEIAKQKIGAEKQARKVQNRIDDIEAWLYKRVKKQKAGTMEFYDLFHFYYWHEALSSPFVSLTGLYSPKKYSKEEARFICDEVANRVRSAGIEVVHSRSNLIGDCEIIGDYQITIP